MKELVDKEKLNKIVQHAKYIDDQQWRLLHNDIEHCTISPAELVEENLKALAVLEELKKELQQRAKRETVSPITYSSLMGLLRHIESQAPSSSLAEPFLRQDKQAKENKRKARAWDKLYSIIVKWDKNMIKGLPVFYEVDTKEMDELLARSKPKAKEGKA